MKKKILPKHTHTHSLGNHETNILKIRAFHPFFFCFIHTLSHNITITQNILSFLFSLVHFSFFYHISHSSNIPRTFAVFSSSRWHSSDRQHCSLLSHCNSLQSHQIRNVCIPSINAYFL
jgi:hypothetical protein